MRSKKKEFYTKRVSQALNSPSKLFPLFNSLLGKNVKPSNPVKLCKDGKLVDDPLQVSEVLNEYFVSIGPSLSANFSDWDQDDVLEPSFSAWLRPTNAEEISQIVMSLSDSKGVGCDGINNKSLKIVLPVILDRLVIMINACLKNGLFPSSLKKAKVVPLPKSRSSDEIDNFRPISVLTGLSKVLEKIIYARLMDHLITNDLLYSKQFGFRPKFSCVDAIAELTENIKSSSSLQLFACVFLDLKKAFDTVDHKILVRKLATFGIRGPFKAILESFLSQRVQCVSHTGVMSSYKTLECGVPQGSVLGPLLFLLYINDMHSICKYSSVLHYADDTSISFELKTSSATSCLQEDLDAVSSWLAKNKLTINSSKSELLLFRQSKVCSLRINGEVLNVVKCSKYLGVQIDNSLTFEKHIDVVCKKVSKLVGLVSRLRYFLPKHVLLKFYDYYIKPKIQYGCLVYGYSSKVKLNRIKFLRKKFLRLINFKRKFDSAEDLFCQEGVLDVVKLHIYDLLKFVLRSKNGFCPYIFKDYFNCCSISRNTRASAAGVLKSFRAKNSLQKNSLKCRGGKLYNVLLSFGLNVDKPMTTSQIDVFVHNFKDKILLFDTQLVDLVFK